jgi:hypothetical protein
MIENLIDWNKIIDQLNLATNIQTFDFNLAFIIFLAYLFIDGLYAYYTLSIVKLKPFSAATSGAIIYLLLAIGVLNYINNFLYLIPLGLGSWFGTFIVIYRKRSVDR